MARKLLICRTASTRWDMRLLVKLLSRTDLMWQLEALYMFSVLRLETALETLLSHTVKITEIKNELISLKASDTSLELCLLWKSSPPLLKLCLHNFFLSSLLQHLLSILFETDINCPLSIPFTTFPCLLFLARSYGTLLIPKFCGHRREGIISIHVTGSRVVWAVVLKFFRFSTFPWSIHFNCVLSYSLFPKWNCSFNLQCIVSTPWFNTRSFNLQVLCNFFLQFLAFLTIFSKKNHHPYWGLLEGHSLPWGKQMHHQIYSEWVSCA